jgi:SAM-dependent methyltransferase
VVVVVVVVDQKRPEVHCGNSMAVHRVRISPLPPWLPWQKLLGPGAFTARALGPTDALCAEGELEREAAADLAARLRGLGFGGQRLEVEIAPPLPRAAFRRALTAEARRRRSVSPGFTRPGTRLDAESRLGLTPEALALLVGRKASGAHVLDACCGAGGNAIGFARAGCRVTAIELAPERLALAQWNARVYGVEPRIRFVAGDARELVPGIAADLLFVDPPWGGDYDKRRVELADLPLLADLLAERSRFKFLLAEVSAPSTAP